MRIEFTQITQVRVQFFKSLIREKSTLDEKMRFIKGNELKLNHTKLLSFFIFKSVWYHYLFPKIIN